MGITSLPNTPRLVNHFKLGADPEFTMHETGGGAYLYAEHIGLDTLKAFGCDMAGRQAELRAYPSRFALEVVASLFDTLNWMYSLSTSYVRGTRWLAIPYNGQDGCGGHIHFGRKRAQSQIDMDLQVLNKVYRVLKLSGVLSNVLCTMRETKTHYGRLNDFRVQAHGYEYRTFPTELSDPWLMYFVLTVSKLLVYEPRHLSLIDSLPEGQALFAFRKLFKLYADVDDDASICLQALDLHGLPTVQVGDFKASWGLTREISKEEQATLAPVYIPSVIKPSEAACHAIFAFLTQKVPLLANTPEVTWSPRVLSKGVNRVTIEPHTLGHIPDIAMGLVSYGCLVKVVNGDVCKIETRYPLDEREIKKAFRRKGLSFYVSNSIANLPDGVDIFVKVSRPAKDRLFVCKKIKAILSESGLFPICEVSKYREADRIEWEQRRQVTKDSAVKAPLGHLRSVTKAEIKPVVPKVAVKKAVKKPLFEEEEF